MLKRAQSYCTRACKNYTFRKRKNIRLGESFHARSVFKKCRPTQEINKASLQSEGQGLSHVNTPMCLTIFAQSSEHSVSFYTVPTVASAPEKSCDVRTRRSVPEAASHGRPCPALPSPDIIATPPPKYLLSCGGRRGERMESWLLLDFFFLIERVFSSLWCRMLLCWHPESTMNRFHMYHIRKSA